jgi:hypothetical protein
MAADITSALRRIDPQDPVRFDFALCHVGMMNGCGFLKPQLDSQCPLRGLCRPKGSGPKERRPQGSGLRAQGWARHKD